MDKLTINNKDIIAGLQASAKNILDGLIPEGAKVCLLDYPNNSNVGDSLIWLGEVQYLKYRKVRIQYTCEYRNYDEATLKQALDDDTIILMHGGGNFGTLWPEEQAFRERVIRSFPHHTIIQFPQSIYFADAESLAASARVINQHSRFFIVVRDARSFEIATTAFSSAKTLLSPDMAFFIGGLTGYDAPGFDRFILSRTDHEKEAGWTAGAVFKDSNTTVEIDDWLDASLTERLLHRIEIHTVGLRKVVDPRNKWLFVLWNILARQRLKRGLSLLQQGRVVVTDRLHAHILSILMGKPHVIIDNANKKISNLFKTWTQAYPGAVLTDRFEDVEEAAKRLDAQLK